MGGVPSFIWMHLKGGLPICTAYIGSRSTERYIEKVAKSVEPPGIHNVRCKDAVIFFFSALAIFARASEQKVVRSCVSSPPLYGDWLGTRPYANWPTSRVPYMETQVPSSDLHGASYARPFLRLVGGYLLRSDR